MRDGKVKRLIRRLDKITEQWDATPVRDGFMVLPPLDLTIPLMVEADARQPQDRVRAEILSALQRNESASQRLMSWGSE